MGALELAFAGIIAAATIPFALVAIWFNRKKHSNDNTDRPAKSR